MFKTKFVSKEKTKTKTKLNQYTTQKNNNNKCYLNNGSAYIISRKKNGIKCSICFCSRCKRVAELVKWVCVKLDVLMFLFFWHYINMYVFCSFICVCISTIYHFLFMLSWTSPPNGFWFFDPVLSLFAFSSLWVYTIAHHFHHTFYLSC